MQTGYVPKVQIFVASSEFAGMHLVWTHTGSQAQPSVMDGYIGFVPEEQAEPALQHAQEQMQVSVVLWCETPLCFLLGKIFFRHAFIAPSLI